MDAHEWARIDRLERQVAYLLNHLGIDPDLAASHPAAAFRPASAATPASTFGSAADIFSAPAAPPQHAFGGPEPGYAGPGGTAAPGPAEPQYPPALLAAVDRGKLIEAIKVYREWTGEGLREAKAAVEALARQRR